MSKMDAGDSARLSKKLTAVDSPRLQVLAEKNNLFTTRGPWTTEVSSRYSSPTRSSPSGQRRCPSPILPRTAFAAVPKRAQSAERKRPSTPYSPPYPSTPIQDSSVGMRLSSRKGTSGRLAEGLWPSTMRSLSVSFQSDTISIPVSKKEMSVSNTDHHPLKPSPNVGHKLVETPTIAWKSTERKKSPLKGKNGSDKLEISKPVDDSSSRLIDQHRWPSRVNGSVSSSGLARSMEIGDKIVRTSMLAVALGPTSLRRPSTTDDLSKPLQKSTSEAAKLISLEESSRLGFDDKSFDDNSTCKYDIHKLNSVSTDQITSTNHAVRSQSLPSPGFPLPSPIKTLHPPSPKASRPRSPSRTPLSSSNSRGTSPFRSRPSTPPSRGVSPSRTRRPDSPTRSNTSTSVLNFIADFHKEKKGASYIEDAHQLRLLHNRYLQWRFANAQAEAVLYIQKARAERMLYNVWTTTLALWDSVTSKKVILQQLKLELKLNSVLNEHMPYLEDWGLLVRDYLSSLYGAVEDLEASTLRLPVSAGARADIVTLKAAVCSAVDVMQAMGSPICFLVSKVEGMNCLLLELAANVARERTMLDECENVLASIAAMLVDENSLRTHLIQSSQS